jgi:hypothetical protein
MKKLIIISIVMMLSAASQAQILGVNFSSALSLDKADVVKDELLYKTNEGYIMPFAQTPVGIKHCLEKFGEIMELNDLDVDNAYKKDVLLASYVDGLTDYGSLNSSLRAGSSELYFSWDKAGYYVGFTMTSEVVAIFFIKQ